MKAPRVTTSPPGWGGRVWLLLLTALLVTACGFQPRGQTPRPPARMEPLRIQGLTEWHPFVRELRNRLEQAGTVLTDDPKAAAGLLRVGPLERRSRVFSVNARNSAVEYEYLFILSYRVEAPPGTLVDQGTLETRRIVYAPGGELLGRVREGEVRERDVYAELARRLIRRLAAQ